MGSEEHLEHREDAPVTAGGSGDPTAVPAAAGLFLLAVGGWLLNTTRPWHKPGHPLVLGLGWAAGLTMLLYGTVLLTRCVRSVHAAGPGIGSGAGPGGGPAARPGARPGGAPGARPAGGPDRPAS
ncbi:hypothetical protein ABZ128_23795 [Streptomyces sp. NPDC006326]|uniref:hypothetical protein n=1 Tax=Streptomyces sp. NPDC006326 TaxID=3156752 RepID=UPI0033A52E2C